MGEFDKVAYQREYMRRKRVEKKLTNKGALEVALLRVVRAKSYAVLFPERILAGDTKFQDVEWQYENEGLKFVKPKESKLA